MQAELALTRKLDPVFDFNHIQITVADDIDTVRDAVDRLSRRLIQNGRGKIQNCGFVRSEILIDQLSDRCVAMLNHGITHRRVNAIRNGCISGKIQSGSTQENDATADGSIAGHAHSSVRESNDARAL